MQRSRGQILGIRKHESKYKGGDEGIDDNFANTQFPPAYRDIRLDDIVI
jgi:hypothetical protein